MVGGLEPWGEGEGQVEGTMGPRGSSGGSALGSLWCLGFVGAELAKGHIKCDNFSDIFSNHFLNKTQGTFLPN